MSRKDFNDYLMQVSEQYTRLLKTLEDMSSEVDSKVISPSQLTQLKQTIAPVKANFDNLNYIRYLLDKPQRKSKHKRYNKVNKNFLKNTQHVNKETVVNRNEEVIREISNITA